MDAVVQRTHDRRATAVRIRGALGEGTRARVSLGTVGRGTHSRAWVRTGESLLPSVADLPVRDARSITGRRDRVAAAGISVTAHRWCLARGFRTAGRVVFRLLARWLLSGPAFLRVPASCARALERARLSGMACAMGPWRILSNRHLDSVGGCAHRARLDDAVARARISWWVADDALGCRRSRATRRSARCGGLRPRELGCTADGAALGPRTYAR